MQFCMSLTGLAAMCCIPRAPKSRFTVQTVLLILIEYRILQVLIEKFYGA